MSDMKHRMNEDDVGSGEKTPGQKDVEQDVQSLSGSASSRDGSHLLQGSEEQKYYQQGQPPGESEQMPASPQLPGQLLKSGDHLARFLAVKQPDETFEAQVYVRLSREPEVAETYIPVGLFGTEAEALSAAEERAKRALREREF